MKKIFFVVSLLVLFFSCSNIDLTSNPDLIFDSGSNSDSKLYSISITLDHERIGGVPFNTNSTDNNSSKSAYGNTDPSSLITRIYYKNHEDNSLYTQLVETDELTFTINLTAGNWDLQAKSYIRGSESPVYVSDVTRLILNDDTIRQYVKLTLNVNTTMIGTGTVKLPVKKTAISVSKCVITWNKRGSAFQSGDTQTLTFPGSNITYFTMNSSSASPVSSGVYEVNFNFQNSSASTLYRCSELVVVYDDLCTDTWEDSGNSEYFASQTSGGKNYLVLCVDDNCISSQAVGDTIYVNPDAADGGNGSFFGEFKTLKAAVEAVNANSNITTICVHENKTYTIDSTITFNNNVNLKTYNKSSSYVGYSTTLKRADGFTDSMFTVSNSKTVAFEGTFIIDGNNSATSVDGAGINNSGILTLKNTQIKNCKTSGMGAGIYNNGTLTFDTGAKVTGCDVYLCSDKKITVASTDIGVITITPDNYNRNTALLEGRINNAPTELSSSHLAYIAKFDVTAKVAGGGTTKYYLDTNAKLIAETIPVSVLAEKISGGANFSDYPCMKVSSKEDFEQILTWFNTGKTNYSGLTVKLDTDITMSQINNFTGIGTTGKPFKGTFDGNNKTVTLSDYSLFNYVDSATIKNVKTEGSVTEGFTYSDWIHYGGICSYANATTIYNCVNNAEISNTGGSYQFLGGITGGALACVIDRCINKGKITSQNNYAGGICARSSGTTGIIRNCVNTGDVEAKGYAAGIIGNHSSYVYNCYNTGKITTTDSQKSGAGIVAQFDGRGDVCNCYNKGQVDCANIANITREIDEDITKIRNNYYYLAGSSPDVSIKGRSDVLTSYACKFTFNSPNIPTATETLTVGSTSSTNVTDLLNAWVDAQTNTSDYLLWKTGSDGFPEFKTE